MLDRAPDDTKVVHDGWSPGYPNYGQPLKLKSMYANGRALPCQWEGSTTTDHAVCVTFLAGKLSVRVREYGEWFHVYEARIAASGSVMGTEEMLERTGMEVLG